MSGWTGHTHREKKKEARSVISSMSEGSQELPLQAAAQSGISLDIMTAQLKFS